jgi:endoglucanase
LRELFALLEALCAAPGVSGTEDGAAALAAEELARFCRVRCDALGSVIGTREGRGAHLLLDAHLDQIGMVVTGVEDGGFLRVAKCGCMDLRVLAGQEVLVHGSETLFGVIPAQAPHLSEKDEEAPDWDALCVDIGCTRERAQRLIPLGSRVRLRPAVRRLGKTRLTSPALDNRAGVAAVLRCLELLQGEETCPLTVLFSVQEETGGVGARAGGFAVAPEEALVVDVSFAQGVGVSSGEAQGLLGGGTMIGVAPGLDLEISDRLFGLAKEHGIAHQTEIMGGRSGTNADFLQGAGRGIPCGLLSIPLRNMHTGAELAALTDIEATAQLLAAYARERGRLG